MKDSPRKAQETMAPTLLTRSVEGHRDDDSRKLVLVDAMNPNAREQGSETIRVLIAYGDTLARAGLHAMLEVEPDIEVAGYASDGEEAVALAGQIRPDVLLIDI